jgi:hypothetical protein
MVTQAKIQLSQELFKRRLPGGTVTDEAGVAIFFIGRQLDKFALFRPRRIRGKPFKRRFYPRTDRSRCITTRSAPLPSYRNCGTLPSSGMRNARNTGMPDRITATTAGKVHRCHHAGHFSGR